MIRASEDVLVKLIDFGQSDFAESPNNEPPPAVSFGVLHGLQNTLDILTKFL
jgi:hypothetical protein